MKDVAGRAGAKSKVAPARKTEPRKIYMELEDIPVTGILVIIEDKTLRGQRTNRKGNR